MSINFICSLCSEESFDGYSTSDGEWICNKCLNEMTEDTDE